MFHSFRDSLLLYNSKLHILEEWVQSSLSEDKTIYSRYRYTQNGTIETRLVFLPHKSTVLDAWFNNDGVLQVIFSSNANSFNRFYSMDIKSDGVFMQTFYSQITNLNPTSFFNLSKEDHVFFDACKFSAIESQRFFNFNHPTYAYVLFGNETLLKNISPVIYQLSLNLALFSHYYEQLVYVYFSIIVFGGSGLLFINYTRQKQPVIPKKI